MSVRILALLFASVAVLSALEDPRVRLTEMEKEHAAKEEAYLRDWLARANLEPVPVPVLDNPKDARPSEAKAFAKAKKINDALATARRIRAGQPVEGMSAVEGEIFRIRDDDIRNAILDAEAMRGGAGGDVKRKPPTGGLTAKKDD